MKRLTCPQSTCGSSLRLSQRPRAGATRALTPSPMLEVLPRAAAAAAAAVAAETATTCAATLQPCRVTMKGVTTPRRCQQSRLRRLARLDLAALLQRLWRLQALFRYSASMQAMWSRRDSRARAASSEPGSRTSAANAPRGFTTSDMTGRALFVRVACPSTMCGAKAKMPCRRQVRGSEDSMKEQEMTLRSEQHGNHCTPEERLMNSAT